jgi:phosphosulfolactate synthase
VLETSGDYIDIVKLGWGTAYVTPNLRRKLDVLGDKRVVIGGTFFEAVFAKDKVDDYKRWLAALGLTHVEISDGAIEIPRERKLELIEELARDFTVLSEVGSKDAEVVFAPYEVGHVDQGGARRRRVEGDHRGAGGRNRRHLPPERRDAHRARRRDRARGRRRRPDLRGPDEAAQAWFVKHFGPT